MDGINSEAAVQTQETFLRAALNRTELLRSKETGKVEIAMANPNQICWACSATTESPKHRWCSVECRDAWSAENE